MGFFEVSSILITLAAVFSFINFRYIRLPSTIGVMLIALIASLLALIVGEWWPAARHIAAEIVNGIDFNRALLHGMLAFLLFAGALHVDLGDLVEQWVPVTLLALLGTAMSTVIVGGLMRLALYWLGSDISTIDCMLFGALISPTDPVAVLSIMKSVGAPKRLETQLAAESLFNDGVGVVIFMTLLSIALDHTRSPTVAGVTGLFLQQAGGGLALGMVCGMITYQLLRRVDHYQLEVLLTLALAMGGYALADELHVSAPIAAVVSGLFIGNRGRAFAMSDTTRVNLDLFWELIDETLNVVLFMLVGLEILSMPFIGRWHAAIAIAVIVTLAARWFSVAMVVGSIRRRRPLHRGTITVLTWGGLRGGISVAMALSLPPGPHRGIIIAMTYGVVVFSILVQGVTIGKVVQRVVTTEAPA
ncbi:MAG TPA: sodium:proton antiporter [Tepidisphaeraceae bacterium]|nr:sodium:proton antiporter [Tepidisphaeraceae bacterium]